MAKKAVSLPQSHRTLNKGKGRWRGREGKAEGGDRILSVRDLGGALVKRSTVMS